MTNQQNQSNKTTIEASQECPACAAMVRPRALFCHKCGRPVPEIKQESHIVEKVEKVEKVENVEKKVETPAVISSDWFAPTMHTQNLELETEQDARPLTENSHPDDLINPTTELNELTKPTVQETPEKEVIVEKTPNRENIVPIDEPLVETPEIKEYTHVESETDNDDFSQTADVESEKAHIITQKPDVVEAKNKPNVVLEKDVVTGRKVSTEKPKTQPSTTRRSSKQIEYVWEESNAPTLRFILGAVILIGLAAFLFWTSYMLK